MRVTSEVFEEFIGLVVHLVIAVVVTGLGIAITALLILGSK